MDKYRLRKIEYSICDKTPEHRGSILHLEYLRLTSRTYESSWYGRHSNFIAPRLLKTIAGLVFAVFAELHTSE